MEDGASRNRVQWDGASSRQSLPGQPACPFCFSRLATPNRRGDTPNEQWVLLQAGNYYSARMIRMSHPAHCPVAHTGRATLVAWHLRQDPVLFHAGATPPEGKPPNDQRVLQHAGNYFSAQTIRQFSSLTTALVSAMAMSALPPKAVTHQWHAQRPLCANSGHS